jgi:hypothetical protein
VNSTGAKSSNGRSTHVVHGQKSGSTIIFVHPAYNLSFSADFLGRIIFFSHNKSANSIFQLAYQHS